MRLLLKVLVLSVLISGAVVAQDTSQAPKQPGADVAAELKMLRKDNEDKTRQIKELKLSISLLKDEVERLRKMLKDRGIDPDATAKPGETPGEKAREKAGQKPAEPVKNAVDWQTNPSRLSDTIVALWKSIPGDY